MVRKMLIFAALACAVRATNAVLWVFLIPNFLWSLRKNRQAILTVILDTPCYSVITCFLLIALDSAYYGRFTFTTLSFMSVNLSGVSLFYGGSPWHYYLSQALPILCTTALPFCLDGLWTSVNGSGSSASRILVQLVVWTIGIYSLAGHKEWRFIHPLLPVLHVFAAKSLVDRSSSKKQAHPKATWSRNLPIRRGYVWFILATIPASVYIIFFYCSAPISVMSYIRSLPSEELEGGSLGFLMPCHSTPGHAYLHRPQLAHGGMWALGCEPPLQHHDVSLYSDQTDAFFDNPLQYLRDRFPSQVNTSFPISPYPVSPPGISPTVKNPWVHEWPRHLIFFGALLEVEGVKILLEQRGYIEIWKRGRSWEGDEDTRKGGVRVWKWHSSS
ncbi:hypothetical protein K435DRAFT_748028 [Dendrothele bispora CBS 962.96]|uniref:Mannosyltransferase n=1 Tax=Dendrothele bispora (strain CBS 962.96) TaxID=1314807 RepID=A0A4S8MM77_DENBC|nr:hypothetical protein K435DRAFT_748028 [Dendrothele bispora CBS 962.96]